MHTEKSHFQALNHYLPCLDDEFIYLVDDWNWQRVKDGTNQAIKEILQMMEFIQNGEKVWCKS